MLYMDEGLGGLLAIIIIAALGCKNMEIAYYFLRF